MNISFEKVLFSHPASFVCREFKLPAFDSPLHFHPEFELTAIIRGKGKRFVGDHIAHYKEGDLVFIGANLPHYWHSEPAEEALSHSIVIQFQERFFQNTFFDIPEMREIRSLVNLSKRGMSISGPASVAIVQRMHQLLHLENSQAVLEIFQILNILSNCQQYELLASAGFVPNDDNADYSRINSICQYIFEHFTEDITSQQAASLVQMTLPSFCYFFKKHMRRNFTTFVNEVRIGQACKLLIETDKNISEIAYQCGFNNLSNFNRRFKELKALSPKGYRKKLLSP